MLTSFLKHMIEDTITYLEKAHNVRGVDFHLWEDHGVVKAKFDYGRVGEGDVNTAICMAIANALVAIDSDEDIV